MDNGLLFIIALALGATFIIGLFLFTCFKVYKTYFKKTTGQEMLQQILDVTSDEEIKPDTEKISLLHRIRFFEKYHLLLQKVGLVKSSSSISVSVILAVLQVIIFAVFAGGMTGSPIIGILVGVASLAISYALMNRLMNRTQQQLANQIGGFLFAMKANVQARQTPENALIKVAGLMPSPLREELIPVKSALLSGGDLPSSIEPLLSSKAPELRELARYIIISSKNGASLERSLDTIEHLVKERQKVNAEKKKALSSTKGSYWVSVIILPAVFLYAYTTDPLSRNFWFHSLISWLVFIGCAVLYTAGVLLAKRSVRVLEDKQA